MSGATIEQTGFKVFPVELQEKDGLFFVICKTFNIIESDISIDQAYIKLNVKRKRAYDELKSLGVIVAPTNPENNSNFLQKWTQISIIFICLFVPCSLITGGTLIAIKGANIINSFKVTIKNQIASVIKNPNQITIAMNNITEKLDNVTPERREEIRIAVHKIVAFMKPYAVELQELSKD